MNVIFTIEAESGALGLRLVESVVKEVGITMKDVSLTGEKLLYKLNRCRQDRIYILNVSSQVWTCDLITKKDGVYLQLYLKSGINHVSADFDGDDHMIR